jgi:hypothetical protein
MLKHYAIGCTLCSSALCCPGVSALVNARIDGVPSDSRRLHPSSIFPQAPVNPSWHARAAKTETGANAGNRIIPAVRLYGSLNGAERGEKRKKAEMI